VINTLQMVAILEKYLGVNFYILAKHNFVPLDRIKKINCSATVLEWPTFCCHFLNMQFSKFEKYSLTSL